MKKRLKSLLKSIVPEKIFLVRSLLIGYWYDLNRYLKHSNSYKNIDTIQKYEALLTYYYHVVEKGLTMPEPRVGFGFENMNRLMKLCLEYVNEGFDVERDTFVHCLSVMEEYLEFHCDADYTVDSELERGVQQLLENRNIRRIRQIEVSSEDFFRHRNSDFSIFSRSRHTVRNYIDKIIPDDVFKECVELAQKSPSACNRQPNHVYIIRDADTQEKVLSLQNGNRGFGHLANAIVVFTGNVSSFRFADERNELYLNSGMFAMSFIYALHNNGIGSCALNWSVAPRVDRKLRRIIEIPDNETITLVLSCGYLPNRIKVAASPRRETNEAVSFI
jgi:nitroreductase